jgi:hypothetical protein
MNEEPKRDPVLREALLDLEGDASLRESDAERLRQAILWSAAGPLARLRERRARTWRDYLSRWAGGLIPAAVAAALALFLLTPGSFRSGDDAVRMGTSPRDALSLVVSGEAAADEVVDAMTGSEAADILASAGGAYTP